MKRSAATWKRVAMSLRGLKEQSHAALGHSTARRQLRVERLQPRELLAADTLGEPALQYTGGITIAGEVASPDVNADGQIDPLDALVIANAVNDQWGVEQLPAGDLNQDQQLDGQDFAAIVQTLQQQGNLVVAQAAAAEPAAMGDGTVLDDRCAANEIIISMLQGQVDVLRAELEQTVDPEQRAFLEANIASLESSIASMQEDLTCGGGGGDGPGQDEGSGTAGSEGSAGSGGSGGTTGSEGTTGSGGGPSDGPPTPPPSDPPDEPTDEMPPLPPPGDPTDPSDPKPPTDPGDLPEQTPGGPGDGPTEELPGDMPPLPPGEPEMPPEDPGDMPTGGGTDGTLGDTPSGDIPPTDIPPEDTPPTDDPPGEIPPEEMPPGEGTLGDGGNTGATEFYVKEMKIVPQGYSQGYHGSKVPPLYEGAMAEIRGKIDGPRHYGELLSPPQLTLQADLNSDGDFDDPYEQASIGPAAATPFFGEEFYWTYPLVDDGPVPGDGEASNVITVRAFFGTLDEEQTGTTDSYIPSDQDLSPDDMPEQPEEEGPRITWATADVLNVAPYWTRPPELTWQVDEDGNPVAQWSIGYDDVGQQDAHRLQVRWGEGPAELLDAEPQPHEDCEEALQGMPCTDEHTVLVAQQVPATAAEAESVTLTVADDDTGTTDYTILNLDVIRNNDDDDENDRPDLLDQGHESEDDLKRLRLSKLFTDETNPKSESYYKGEFKLRYDLDSLLIWESKDKETLILPEGWTEDFLKDRFIFHPQGVNTTSYTGQKTVWVEGLEPSRTRVRLEYIASDDQELAATIEPFKFLGHATVTVWGVDADMDSDNSTSIDYSEWEEYLEDSEYAIGKMLFYSVTNSQPVNVQITPHLDPEGPVQLVVSKTKFSGNVSLWNDPSIYVVLDHADVRSGGNQLVLESPTVYSLKDLNYNPDTGLIRLFTRVTSVTPFHDDKAWIDATENLEDWFTFSLSGASVADSSQLKDNVKWMAVNPGTFYAQLDANRHLRGLAASDLVYGDPDAPPLPPPFDGAGPAPPRPIDNAKYALKMLSEQEVSNLFPMPDAEDERERVLDVLFNRKEAPGDPSSIVWDLQAALYLDHAAKGSPAYILGFRGTEQNIGDWFANLSQLLTHDNSQYSGAVRTTQYLVATPALKGRLTTAGHSLGGGLASAAAVVNNVPADTFNAAGVQRHTIGMLAFQPTDEQPYDALATFDAGAKDLVNAYVVYPEEKGPNGTLDAHDLLNLMQNCINRPVSKNMVLIPKALGTVHVLQGLYTLSPQEVTFLVKVVSIIDRYVNDTEPSSNALSALVVWLNDLVQLISEYENWEPVYEKLSESHRIPSLWYGVLHDGQKWNNYHARRVTPSTQ